MNKWLKLTVLNMLRDEGKITEDELWKLAYKMELMNEPSPERSESSGFAKLPRDVKG